MIKEFLWLREINLYDKVIDKIKNYQFISPCIFLKRKSEGLFFNFKKLFFVICEYLTTTASSTA